MSSNSFDASDAPAWFTTLPSLTSYTLRICASAGWCHQLSSLLVIQILKLRGNRFNGTLTIRSDFISQLQLIDLQDNQIEEYGVACWGIIIQPDTPGDNRKYCTATGQANQEMPPYATAKNCSSLPPLCLSYQMLSPTCICAVPYKGTVFFRSPPFSDLSNSSYFIRIEQEMKSKFLEHSIPLDSVAIHDPFFNAHNNLQMSLELFPCGKTRFSEQDISDIGFMLSNQTYKPTGYGPYFFIGQAYTFTSGGITVESEATNHIPLIVRASVGGGVVAAVILALAIIMARRKRKLKKTEQRSQPFAQSPAGSWGMKSSNDNSAPQLCGARMFTFNELKITSNFSCWRWRRLGVRLYGQLPQPVAAPPGDSPFDYNAGAALPSIRVEPH